MTHGDDFVLTGPTKKLVEFEKRKISVYPIKAKIISHGSPKNIKTLNRRLRSRKRGLVHQHDPRHVDVLVKDLGLERQWGHVFEYGKMAEELTVFTDPDLEGCKETRKSFQRMRAVAGRTHHESIHTKAEGHRKEQCRSRIVCSSIGSVRIKRNRVVAERPGVREEASV